MNEDEISKIVKKLKDQKLSNIYSGREISIILKKNQNKNNSVVNIIYPVSNTIIIEVRNNNNQFSIKKI